MSRFVMTLIVGSLLTQGAMASRGQGREGNQQARIQQGARSGQLTRSEVRNLNHHQAHIDRVRARAMADGVMTTKEARKIDKMEDRQSRRIFNEKHNGRQIAGHQPVTPAVATAQPVVPPKPVTLAPPATPAQPAVQAKPATPAQN